MRQNLLLTLLLIACGIIAYDHFFQPAQITHAQTSPTASGRYQLFQGQFLFTSKTATATIPVIFRIDSATGATWNYLVMQDDNNKKIQDWVLIRESAPPRQSP
jgi:hypothetical protein